MRSKRYRAVVKEYDRSRSYPIEEAIELVKKTSQTRFDASVEVHIRLGIDASKAEQMVRATALLPHGTGKKLRIAVFAKGTAAAAAKQAGADIVGDDDLVGEIKKTGKTDFDIAVATPEMMKTLAPIAKTLGTKGLMPNPKNETVTSDPGAMVEALRGGKVSFKSDATGNIHQVIGRVSFSTKNLQENYATLLDAVKKGKPSEAKGTYIRGVVIAGSMGPGVRVLVGN